jgi:hypothetical protein
LGNFRFCASFNCPPGIPFFPASYSKLIKENDNEYIYNVSIALESGDLLVKGFQGV